MQEEDQEGPTRQDHLRTMVKPIDVRKRFNVFHYFYKKRVLTVLIFLTFFNFLVAKFVSY